MKIDERLSAEIEEMESGASMEKEDSSVDINKLVKDFVELKEITRTMMVSLIDRIEVSEDKEITIYYKFNILNIRKLNDEEELINVG